MNEFISPEFRKVWDDRAKAHDKLAAAMMKKGIKLELLYEFEAASNAMEAYRHNGKEYIEKIARDMLRQIIEMKAAREGRGHVS